MALGGLLFILVLLFVPNSADPQPGRLDGGGFVLGSLALGTLIYAGISGEQYGYSTWWIIALFVVSGVAAMSWVLVEQRVQSPMLDLKYLKNAAVSSALFLAFAVYFGIFSIFFLTALYLDLIVGYNGGQMASVFAPMAVGIVGGSVASGFWVGHVGPRGPMITGSLLSAVGIVLARYALVAHPHFAGLALTLTIAGVGFGITVVPLTAAVLGHVPAEHSGMAASATNTARQLGAVVGVAALGAIVNSRLTSQFGASLTNRGVGGSGKDFILRMLETGGSAASGLNIAHPDPLIKPLVDDATAAFRSGLHLALLVAAVLIAVAAVGIAFVPRRALAPDTEI